MSHKVEAPLLLLIIALFAYALLQKSCDGVKDGDIVKSDTVYVVGTPDTVIIHDTIAYENTTPVPVYVLVNPDSNSADVSACDSIRHYTDSVHTASGSVFVFSQVLGKLQNIRIEANVLSKEITRTDTVFITNERIKQRKFGLYAGAMYDNQLRPFIGADLNRTFLIAGYGLQDKSVTVGVGYRLTK